MTTDLATEPRDWFFTFGANHHHPDTGQSLRKAYVRVHGTADSTRNAMLGAFGKNWSGQYHTTTQAGVDKYGLTEVPMPADDDALREAYAQDEADQDRTPSEAGFREWKARRRAVSTFRPPATPAEARTGVTDVEHALLDELATLRRLVGTFGPMCEHLHSGPDELLLDDDRPERADDLNAAIRGQFTRIETIIRRGGTR